VAKRIASHLGSLSFLGYVSDPGDLDWLRQLIQARAGASNSSNATIEIALQELQAVPGMH